jgi:hypothetical protein
MVDSRTFCGPENLRFLRRVSALSACLISFYACFDTVSLVERKLSMGAVTRSLAKGTRSLVV